LEGFEPSFRELRCEVYVENPESKESNLRAGSVSGAEVSGLQDLREGNEDDRKEILKPE